MEGLGPTPLFCLLRTRSSTTYFHHWGWGVGVPLSPLNRLPAATDTDLTCLSLPPGSGPRDTSRRDRPQCACGPGLVSEPKSKGERSLLIQCSRADLGDGESKREGVGGGSRWGEEAESRPCIWTETDWAPGLSLCR